MTKLQELLDPLPIREFIDTYWTQKVLHVRHASDKFKGTFSWDMFNKVLEHHIHFLTTSQLSLSMHGKAIPASELLDSSMRRHRRFSSAKIKSHCAQGATLIINGAQKLSSALMNLSQALQYDLNERNQINIYASHSAQQGFNTHFDTHEVLVLQIEGSKDWQVYEDRPNKYPKSGAHDRLSHHPSTPRHITITQGDLLYIPRGIYHMAQATKEPSLHLTIGISCRTEIDFLRWAIEKLNDNPSFRKNLPIVIEHGDTKYDHSGMEAVKKNLLFAVKRLMENDAIVKEFQEHSSKSLTPNNSFAFPIKE